MPTTTRPTAGWRVRLGVIVFALGFLSPLLTPVVAAMALPTRWKVGILGALAVGIPEVMTVIAAAIMGKVGFLHIKERLLGFFKKYGPADRVSPLRYRIGLLMFVIPLLFGWLAPYVSHIIPGYEANRFWVSLVGDLMFVSSLFVLGGDFWDKVRALFVHGARVQIPVKKSS